MLKRILLLLLLTLLMSIVRAQDDTLPAPVSPTLAAIQARGQLVCGVDGEVFGFGFLNPNTGDLSGLQVDFCRALAAATLGEAAAVDYRLHSLDDAPADSLAEGVDVLFHHLFIPDLEQGLQPGLDTGRAVIFYDGTSVMLEGSNRPAEWADLAGATVCVVAESPSARDFAAEMTLRESNYDAVVLPAIAAMRTAFAEGQCSAQVLDRSLLEIIRSSTTAPDTFTVWATPFTRRAITPLYPYGDEQWGDLVDWTLWGVIQAEKLGVSSQNIDSLIRRTDEATEDYLRRVGDSVARLIDAELGLGGHLGLASDFMANVIRQVGNYGEIYDRSLGPQSGLPIERGLNALWTNGGLLDAPAWR